MVLIVNAVLETPDTVDSSFWPVADLPPHQFMALSGRMSPLEVGTSLAMLVDSNSQPGDEDRPPTDAGEAIRHLLKVDKVIARGGLRVHDTRTNVTVRPGCCCGLEDWREWLDVANGETLWLGHDPSPRLEYGGETVQLWPDGGAAQETPSGPPIEIMVADLSSILQIVHEELRGFLSVTKQWARSHVPTLAEDLVARLGEDLAVTGPLSDAGVRHAS
ncbi:hypothetical protein ACFRDV_35740 [Streptomyces fagopyri]|uniref:hypothetical protein n=1 Tax=Streptomyces fagopyri TaxID=2662397 RepID=UPI0036CFF5EB